MKAIIKTDNRNLFYSLLDFLRTIPVSVEINEDNNEINEKLRIFKIKSLNEKPHTTQMHMHSGVL